MTENIHATVKRMVTRNTEWPEVRAVYRVELSPDAKQVVSSELSKIEQVHWEAGTERTVTSQWTPEEAQRLAVAIFDLLQEKRCR